MTDPVVNDALFNTIGGLITFLTALVGFLTVLVNDRKRRKQIESVKEDVKQVHETANGRTSALLRNNAEMRELLTRQGIEPPPLPEDV